MLGERYFAARGRLDGVTRGIAALAAEACPEAVACLTPPENGPDPSKPFILAACGEVNAGKSTLFNGLFGAEVCQAGALPDSNRILFYRHGPAARNTPSTENEHLEERLRPFAALRDFHLIEVPGTNSMDRALEAASAIHLEETDVILAVLPVTNPWAAATWDYLSSLPEEFLGRTLLVIQQSDRREPEDVTVILGHVRDLSIKRIGRVLPTFVVSGKLALEARQLQPRPYGLWKASGYEALEDHLSRWVCLSGNRRRMLQAQRERAAASLHLIEERMDDLRRGMDRGSRFLAEIEREIDTMRQRFVQRLPRHLLDVADVFRSEAVRVAKRLRWRLGPFPTLIRLFTGDHTGPEIEELFLKRLKSAVERVATDDATETMAACLKHRESLASRVKDELGVDLGDPTELVATLESARAGFIERLGTAAHRGVGNLKTRNLLDASIRRRNAALKPFVALPLLALTVAGLSGVWKLPWLPGIALGLAAAGALVFTILAILGRRPIVRDLLERLEDTCGPFAGGLRGDFTEALRVFFQEYARSLQAVRRHIADEKLELEPRFKRWNSLFLELKAIEQDL